MYGHVNTFATVQLAMLHPFHDALNAQETKMSILRQKYVRMIVHER